MSKPTFSVIIPAYKAAHLEGAVRSVLDQTCDDYELVVVNDCSPQGIDKIMEKFDDPRIRYQRTPQNLGSQDPSQTWNYALGLAKGDFIVLLGDDDELAPNFLEEMIGLIRQHPGAAIFRARLRLIDNLGNLYEHGLSLPESETWDEYLYFRFKYWRLHSTSEMTVNASALRKIGGYVSMPGAIGSDDLTWLKLCTDHPIISTNKTYACWRRHPESLSTKLLDGASRKTYFHRLFTELLNFLDNHEALVIDSKMLKELLSHRLQGYTTYAGARGRAKELLRDLLPPLFFRHLRSLRTFRSS